MSRVHDAAPVPGTLPIFEASPEQFPGGVQIIGDADPEQIGVLQRHIQLDLEARGLTPPSGRVTIGPTYWIVGGAGHDDAAERIGRTVDETVEAMPELGGDCFVRGYRTQTLLNHPDTYEPTHTLVLLSGQKGETQAAMDARFPGLINEVNRRLAPQGLQLPVAALPLVS